MYQNKSTFLKHNYFLDFHWSSESTSAILGHFRTEQHATKVAIFDVCVKKKYFYCKSQINFTLFTHTFFECNLKAKGKQLVDEYVPANIKDKFMKKDDATTASHFDEGSTYTG